MIQINYSILCNCVHKHTYPRLNSEKSIPCWNAIKSFTGNVNIGDSCLWVKYGNLLQTNHTMSHDMIYMNNNNKFRVGLRISYRLPIKCRILIYRDVLLPMFSNYKKTWNRKLLTWDCLIVFGISVYYYSVFITLSTVFLTIFYQNNWYLK